MAVVSQNQQDQQTQDQSGTSQTNTSGGNGAGVTTVVSGSKGGSGSASNAAPTVQNAQFSQNNTPSSSGSFTNLKSYLNANNGGQQFTSQINNNLGQQGQQIQSSVNNASNQFNQQAQQVINPLQTAYQNFQQNGGATGDASKIASYAADNNNANSVRNLENSQYTGPKSLNDLSGANNGAAIQSNIKNYQSLANSTTTEPGRFSLLQNMFGGNGYTQGQQTLDNLFIDPSQLSASRSAANQAQNAYNQASNNAQVQGQNYQNQVGEYAKGTVGGLNSAVNNQYQNVQGRVQNAINAQNQAVNGFVNNFNTGKISAADAAALGIKAGDATYNLDPTQFITRGNTPSLQNVASSDDYKNFAGLQNLLGQNTDTQTSGILSQFQDPSKAGQMGNPYNLDQQGYSAALASAKDAYQQAVNPVQQQLDILNSGLTQNPYTYQGQSGNGWMGSLNDMANALRGSGWANQHAGADVSNEDLVKLAENSGGFYNEGYMPGGGASSGSPGAVDMSKYLTPYYNQAVQHFVPGYTASSSGIVGDPTAFTDMVDAMQQQAAAKQEALKNLASQYGANKNLSFE